MIEIETTSGSHDRRTRRGRIVLLAVVGLCLFATPAALGQTGLTGIDVSNWQRQIDWIAASGSGHSFVFAKATEGATFTDVTFPLNRAGAPVAAMRFGAYHFARPAGGSDAAVVADAIGEADHFLEVAMPRRGELLPVLDLENAGGLSVARLSLWTQTWLGHVFARTGLRAIVYASPNFWKTRLGDTTVTAAAGHKLWIAHWTKDALPILPGANWGGLGWTFWQFSDCTRVPGIAGCVDGNRFAGTNLGTVTVRAYPTGPVATLVAPSIVGTPQAGKVLAAVPGWWNGGKPISFAYQWQRCDAAGRGCAPIIAATAETYVPTTADVGRALVVRVTATAAQGSAAASSNPTLAIANSGTIVGTAPKPRSLPTITGTTMVGQVLSALAGTWSGSPSSFSYQWQRCAPDGTACVAIDAAGATTYTITPGDIGAKLSITVTAVGKGGAGSATAIPTAVVAAAPVPVPVVGSTFALAGQAGAVISPAGIAVATWQPGALPDQATVALSDIASRLAVPGTVVNLAIGAPAPLPWPINVQYASTPEGTVPGVLPTSGVWQPLAELPTPALPAGQNAGAYRDGAGALHVLTRTSARIALFADGKWGDPRFTTAARPRVEWVTEAVMKATPDGGAVVLGRITLSTQAHLYVSLTAANGRKLLLPQKGTRIGWWLQGTKPAKTLQALQLRPGSIPIRLRVPAAELRAAGPYTLQIRVLDPYGRRTTLSFKTP